MRILGIDPGLVGGAAIIITGDDLDGPPRIWDAIDIPTKGVDAKRRVDVLALSRWIVAGRPDLAFIERAGTMPGQGIASGFVYGRAVGALEAAVILANVPLDIVEPRIWKAHFGLIGADKDASRQMILTGIPDAVKWLDRKKDHGRAEAILIAMYGADNAASIDSGRSDQVRSAAR